MGFGANIHRIKMNHLLRRTRPYSHCAMKMITSVQPKQLSLSLGMDNIQNGRLNAFRRLLNTKEPDHNASPMQTDIIIKKPKFDFTVPPGQFIEVDGMQIHYEKLGTGSEVLVMMTPGMGSTRIDYHDQLEKLDRNKFTLIGWDPPGYGFSRPPERKYPLDMGNKDAEVGHKLLKKLGVEKANVMGYCYGNIPAMILAADRPEVVKKLVLVESYSYYTDQHMIHYDQLRQLKNWYPDEAKRSVDVYGSRDYFEKKMNQLLDYGIRIRNEKGRNFCAEKLSLIRCPTLLLNTKLSKAVTQDHPFYMLNAIENARMVLLEKGSHAEILKKNPELVNQIIADFIFENEDE